MKKGFTLVELLAVIVILAVILIIAIPQVLKVVDNSRINAYIKNEQMVLKAVDVYVSRNTGELPGEIGDTTEVSINYLVSNGMLTGITNPYNKNEDCTGYVTIMKLSDTEYDYTPHLRCGLDIHDSSDDGLVGHWKLHGNAFDYSMNNNHGTMYGVIFTNDRFNALGKVVCFSGEENYVEVENSDDFNGMSEFSVSAWIKYESLSNENYAPIGKEGLFRIVIGPSGNLSFAVRTEDNEWYSTGTVVNAGNVVINRWYYIVGIYDGNKIRIYVDGKFINEGSTNISGNLYTNDRSFNMGRSLASNIDYFNGCLDDVRIYNRALSEHEIKMLYETTK